MVRQGQLLNFKTEIGVRPAILNQRWNYS